MLTYSNTSAAKTMHIENNYASSIKKAQDESKNKKYK